MGTVVLEKNKYIAVAKCYKNNKLNFPIISSVLENKQEGFIFLLKDYGYLVIHKFGFCQLLNFEDGFKMNIDWRSIYNIVKIEKLRFYDYDINLNINNLTFAPKSKHFLSDILQHSDNTH
jgi:hypothetical protein